jgi:phenylpyruvate tautomerase PptA (4-oxalocrotonate tautomerase family)
MPFIQTKVSIKITEKTEKAIKAELGKAIEIFPGKSENWLMLSFEDCCRLYFQGKNDQPIAFVEVKLFGKATDEEYSKMTATITDILKRRLDISPDHIYIKYEEVANWGWNGKNF